jgi:hypothetical protein
MTPADPLPEKNFGGLVSLEARRRFEAPSKIWLSRK